ncbi:hypothetical protein ABXS75_11010 [Roseburia hominis]
MKPQLKNFVSSDDAVKYLTSIIVCLICYHMLYVIYCSDSGIGFLIMIFCSCYAGKKLSFSKDKSDPIFVMMCPKGGLFGVFVRIIMSIIMGFLITPIFLGRDAGEKMYGIWIRESVNG